MLTEETQSFGEGENHFIHFCSCSPRLIQRQIMRKSMGLNIADVLNLKPFAREQNHGQLYLIIQMDGVMQRNIQNGSPSPDRGQP
jgi:hypothetical protein